MISVNSINKFFTQGEEVIKAVNNVSFNINKGETVAITGSSGSGKTTLLTLLAGLDRPDSGGISILDNEIFNFSEKKLGEFRGTNIGIVFQRFHLMPYLSAFEKVMLPLEILGVRNYKQQAREALEKVGLEKRINHMPNELSGGECQRVAIARAIVTNPKILLADEPSGNLDSQTGEKVMKLLFDLAKEHHTSLILVTHDESLAAKCDRQLKMTNGELLN